MSVRRANAAFDHPEWIFELKYDGFRALALLGANGARLIGRSGSPYKQFSRLRAGLRESLKARSAVVDGEIVCLDHEGRAAFDDLYRHRGDPSFVAFDLLWLDGRDLRDLPLVRRKRLLRRVIPLASPWVFYADHVEDAGTVLFEESCRRDFEGVVAKWKLGRYRLPSSWFGIGNPGYSHARQDAFERRRAS